MSFFSHSSPRRAAAFTLLELLVAMSVFALLVVLLMSMVDTASKLWRQNETRVDAYREARAALNIISDDLRGMIASTNTNFFATNFVKTIPVGGESGSPGLFFVTPLALAAQPSTNKSDLCAVGYFRRWSKQNVDFGGSDTITPEGYHLFRSFYGSDLTYSNLVSAKPPLEDLGEPTAKGQPPSEILARNISDFQVLCFTTNGVTGAQKFRPWTPAISSAPNLIEVRITAIPDEVAKKLNGTKTNWSTNNALVNQSMRTFVSRIPVPSAQP